MVKKTVEIDIEYKEDGTARLIFDIPEEIRKEMKEVINRNKVLDLPSRTHDALKNNSHSTKPLNTTSQVCPSGQASDGVDSRYSEDKKDDSVLMGENEK